MSPTLLLPHPLPCRRVGSVFTLGGVAPHAHVPCCARTVPPPLSSQRLAVNGLVYHSASTPVAIARRETCGGICCPHKALQTRSCSCSMSNHRMPASCFQVTTQPHQDLVFSSQISLTAALAVAHYMFPTHEHTHTRFVQTITYLRLLALPDQSKTQPILTSLAHHTKPLSPPPPEGSCRSLKSRLYSWRVHERPHVVSPHHQHLFRRPRCA